MERQLGIESQRLGDMGRWWRRRRPPSPRPEAKGLAQARGPALEQESSLRGKWQGSLRSSWGCHKLLPPYRCASVRDCPAALGWLDVNAEAADRIVQPGTSIAGRPGRVPRTLSVAMAARRELPGHRATWRLVHCDLAEALKTVAVSQRRCRRGRQSRARSSAFPPHSPQPINTYGSVAYDQGMRLLCVRARALAQTRPAAVVQQVLQCAPHARGGGHNSASGREGHAGLVRTGLSHLDDALGGGLRAGHVTELVGPAGSLKSQVAICAAAQAATSGQPVWVISSRADEVARRIRQVIVATSTRAQVRGQECKAVSAGEAVSRVKLTRCFNLAALAVAVQSEPEFDGFAVGSAFSREDGGGEPAPTAAARQPRKRPRECHEGPLPPALVILDSIHTPASPCVGPLRVAPKAGGLGIDTVEAAPAQQSSFGGSAGAASGALLALVGRSLRALARRTGAAVVFSNGAVPSRARSGAAQQAALGSALAGAADVVVGMWHEPGPRGSTLGNTASTAALPVAGWRDISARLAPAFVAADAAAEAVVLRGSGGKQRGGQDADARLGGGAIPTAGTTRRSRVCSQVALCDGLPGAGWRHTQGTARSQAARCRQPSRCSWSLVAPAASAAAVADSLASEWPELAFAALRCSCAAQIGQVV